MQRSTAQLILSNSAVIGTQYIMEVSVHEIIRIINHIKLLLLNFVVHIRGALAHNAYLGKLKWLAQDVNEYLSLVDITASMLTGKLRWFACKYKLTGILGPGQEQTSQPRGGWTRLKRH